MQHACGQGGGGGVCACACACACAFRLINCTVLCWKAYETTSLPFLRNAPQVLPDETRPLMPFSVLSCSFLQKHTPRVQPGVPSPILTQSRALSIPTQIHPCSQKSLKHNSKMQIRNNDAIASCEDLSDAQRTPDDSAIKSRIDHQVIVAVTRWVESDIQLILRFCLCKGCANVNWKYAKKQPVDRTHVCSVRFSVYILAIEKDICVSRCELVICERGSLAKNIAIR